MAILDSKRAPSEPLDSALRKKQHTMNETGCGGAQVPSRHVAVESSQGRRPAMEDTYVHGVVRVSSAGSAHREREGEETLLVAGVFDGHGGKSVAQYIAQHMPDRICSYLQGDVSCSSHVAAAMSAAYKGLDQELASRKQAILKGSTAVVALVTATAVHLSSCGDSRAIICHRGEAIQLVEDHTPLREDEQARIRKAGGQVFYHNGCRVMGALAMSRAIGDHALRPYGVIADPDTAHYTRRSGDEFLILATDGLWAAMCNQDAADLISYAVRELTQLGMSRRQITAVLPKLLTKVALARGSSDNITVLVLDLQLPEQAAVAVSGTSGSSAASSPRCAPVAAQQQVQKQQQQQQSPSAGASAAGPGNISKNGSSSSSSAIITANAVELMKQIIRQAASEPWRSRGLPPDPAAAASQAAAAASQAAAAAIPDAPSSEVELLGDSPFAAAAAAAGEAVHVSSIGVAADDVAVVVAETPADLAAPAAAPAAAAATAQSVSAAVATALMQQQQQQQLDSASDADADAAPAGSPSNSRDRPSSSGSSHSSEAADVISEELSEEALATREASCWDYESAFASPFMNHQQHALTEVWQDWAGVKLQQQCSGSGVADVPMVCSCRSAEETIAKSRKRRMVTTESPVVLGAAWSAPAKLQRLAMRVLA